MESYTSYTTIRQPSHATIEEKKSIFHGFSAPVTSEEEAQAFLAQIRKKYPDARHHVYAYCLREGHTMRYSDDHEPQGTAGLPVLGAIQKGGYIDTIVVVVRYFGGVLLGTGGLVHAYTQTASESLKLAGKKIFRTAFPISFVASYADFQKVQTKISGFALAELSIDYAENVTVNAFLPKEQAESFAFLLTEITNGKSALQLADEVFFPFPEK